MRQEEQGPEDPVGVEGHVWDSVSSSGFRSWGLGATEPAGVTRDKRVAGGDRPEDQRGQASQRWGP